MSDKQTEKIEPVDFDLANSPIFSGQAGVASRKKSSILVWSSLGVLTLLALAVIFVLPGIVSRYELPLEPRISVADLSPATQQTVRPGINAVSPFDEAQRSMQRKEAQDRLAELLTAQATLTAGKVELWGNEEYQQALEQARLGDEAYLAQNFIDARNNYLAGTEVLNALINSIPRVLAAYLAEGEAALSDNDSATALDRFTIALGLEPGNQQAAIGYARAESLDQVNELIARAEASLEVEELQQAREQYQQAVLIDDRHVQAREGLVAVDRLILENRFAQMMSAGFVHLQNDEPQQAIEAFRRAAALGINTDQARAAITQTQDEVARVEIEGHRNAALMAEKNEQWQTAVAAYDAALAVDPNLVFAITGKDYAQKRSHLDQLLVAAIDNPERLGDQDVYNQTVDVYYTGQNLEAAGPRLTNQLDVLEQLLETSQIPVAVQLVSDNVTNVSLLRVAELGMFQSQSLSLKPGRYVAVGTRSGFRDVRQEFFVGFGQTPDAVVIQCDEQVVSTRGR
ncbi:MAG: hypothetical protein WD772_03090 [Pseudohongiellaceae bacterium]